MRIVTQFGIAALAAATMTAAPHAMAQQGTTATTDARWEAFIGCWAPEAGLPGPTAVCVLPAGGARVEVVTIADGRFVAPARRLGAPAV